MLKKEKLMHNRSNRSNFQQQKMELIRLRIKNHYYDRDEILKKVVQEVYERNIKNK